MQALAIMTGKGGSSLHSCARACFGLENGSLQKRDEEAEERENKAKPGNWWQTRIRVTEGTDKRRLLPSGVAPVFVVIHIQLGGGYCREERQKKKKRKTERDRERQRERERESREGTKMDGGKEMILDDLTFVCL